MTSDMSSLFEVGEELPPSPLAPRKDGHLIVNFHHDFPENLLLNAAVQPLFEARRTTIN